MAKQNKYIYGLIHPDDPLTNKYVRYVGASIHPEERLNQHIYRSGYATLPIAFCEWLEDIEKSNKKPKILILEIADADNWRDRESFWIKKLLKRNRLFNAIFKGCLGWYYRSMIKKGLYRSTIVNGEIRAEPIA